MGGGYIGEGVSMGIGRMYLTDESTVCVSVCKSKANRSLNDKQYRLSCE